MEKLKILYYILLFSSLLVFEINRAELAGSKIKLLRFILLLSIITEGLVDIIYHHTNVTSWFIFHIYQPIEYVLLALLFYNNIVSTRIRQYILLSIPIYLISIGIYYVIDPSSLFLQKYLDFVIESFLISIWAALYLLETISSDNLTEPIVFIPLFWISFAVMIFYSGSIFIMGFRYYLDLTAPNLGKITRSVGHYLNFVFYLLLIFSFIWIPFMKKPSLD